MSKITIRLNKKALHTFSTFEVMFDTLSLSGENSDMTTYCSKEDEQEYGFVALELGL